MRNAAAIAVMTLTVLVARASWATEVCGNGIDDDGTGSTDEDCAPTLTTGVCESPLSCMQTGMVSWSTGALRYDVRPDVTPKVPYGPGIGFARTWLSMSTPGTNPTSERERD